MTCLFLVYDTDDSRHSVECIIIYSSIGTGWKVSTWQRLSRSPHAWQRWSFSPSPLALYCADDRAWWNERGEDHSSSSNHRIWEKKIIPKTLFPYSTFNSDVVQIDILTSSPCSQAEKNENKKTKRRLQIPRYLWGRISTESVARVNMAIIEEGIIIIARGISRVLPASTDAAQPRSQLRPQEP